MRIFLFFVDGIGLGRGDPDVNPFARAHLPTLTQLTSGARWLQDLPRRDNTRALFVPTDACLGIGGTPQSATGQASLMTGRNVPRIIDGHYGPKPDARIGAVIRSESVVKKLTARGLRAGFLNAYPAGYLEKIATGVRLRSANQLAMHVGGVPMRGPAALYDGTAVSGDLTGAGWREVLGYPDAPVITPFEAGQRLARLAQAYDFSLFDYWLTDRMGHRCAMDAAVEELGRLDEVMAGLISEWDDADGLIVLTSDHGNLEDCSVRGHTQNRVPTLIVGDARHEFAAGLNDLTDFAAAILQLLTGGD